jgi:hypothetical protein
MAAMFAGASRALLTSAVFAFETTLQPISLLPLLGGCTASFLLSCLMMRNTIMTEKIARRGVRVPGEYAADFLDQLNAGLYAARPVVTLNGDDLLDAVRAWIATHGTGTSHQGFPVVNGGGNLIGVVTRRDLLDPERPGSARVRELIKRPVAVVFDDLSAAGGRRPHGAGGRGTAPGGHARGAAQADRDDHPQRSALGAPAAAGRDARRRAEPELAGAARARDVMAL